MANPHHRKKHKEHVRQFKHSHEATASVKTKGKASGVFIFAGVVAGLLVSYFASNGILIWMAAGVIAGGLAGYLIGRRIESEK